MSQRPLRGMPPPLITVLAVTTAFALPALATTASGANAAPALSAAPPARAAAAAHSAEWWLASLNVAQAWRYSYGSGVTVAVLSTGVNPGQPGLAGDVTTGPDFSMSGRSAGGPFWGSEGTAVAGVIAGHGRGAPGTSGITGIAPDARILSLRVTLEYNDPLNSDTGLTRRLPDAIASGISYAVSHGARVIDLPLDPGTLGFPQRDRTAAGGSAAERAAVGNALSKGVLLVAPAGDDGEGTGIVNFPAAYPGVIAVGAIGANGSPAPFTSKRSYVSLTAPGVNITVPAPPAGYAAISTTDVAAAVTSGVAALIRSRFPGLTVAQVAQALERSTTAAGTPHAPGPAGAGYGTVNAGRALQAAAAIAAPPRPAPAPRKHTVAPRRHPAARTHATNLSARKGTAGAVSVLQAALIGVGLLILALLAALLTSRFRRRRRNAARLEGDALGQARHPARGRGAARGSHAVRSNRKARQAAAAQQESLSQPDPWRSVRVSNGQAATAHPRMLPLGQQAPAAKGSQQIAPLPRTTTGGVGRAAKRADRNAGNPPWEAAPMPEDGPLALPEASLRQRPSPSPGAPQSAAPDGLRPPWEDGSQEISEWRDGGQFAAAPVPADLPDWRPADAPASASTGPMYVWNPAAQDEDQDEDDPQLP